MLLQSRLAALFADIGDILWSFLDDLTFPHLAYCDQLAFLVNQRGARLTV